MMDPEIYTQHLELKGELEQVKSALKETQKELLNTHKTNVIEPHKETKPVDVPENKNVVDKKIIPNNSKKTDSSRQETVRSI